MRRNRDATEIGQVRSQSIQGHNSEARTYWPRGSFRKKTSTPFCVEFVAASRFYRFFDYELSIFIACRVLRKSPKMPGHPTAARGRN
jgi:hypothetical protein